MNEIKKVIEIAEKEVGYLEKASNDNLDSKTTNAGNKNYTKFARDLDLIPNFYNGKKNGYAWCDVFVDWCFVQAVGQERALDLLCQTEGSCGAGCGFSMNYYKAKGQLFNEPKIGDQIFFKSGNSIEHTGLVYNVDESRVYTIEGNTSSAEGVVANGGAVAKKSYLLNSSYIAGYGRPNYNTDGEEEIPVQKVESNNRVAEWQSLMNRLYNEKLVVDNIYGKLSSACANRHCVSYKTPLKHNEYALFIQTRLKELGFYVGELDGLFGKLSDRALREFQKSRNLIVDGVCGANSIRELLK